MIWKKGQIGKIISSFVVLCVVIFIMAVFVLFSWGARNIKGAPDYPDLVVGNYGSNSIMLQSFVSSGKETKVIDRVIELSSSRGNKDDLAVTERNKQISEIQTFLKQFILSNHVSSENSGDCFFMQTPAWSDYGTLQKHFFRQKIGAWEPAPQNEKKYLEDANHILFSVNGEEKEIIYYYGGCK
jgi:hypothetical protein